MTSTMYSQGMYAPPVDNSRPPYLQTSMIRRKSRASPSQPDLVTLCPGWTPSPRAQRIEGCRQCQAQGPMASQVAPAVGAPRGVLLRRPSAALPSSRPAVPHHCPGHPRWGRNGLAQPLPSHPQGHSRPEVRAHGLGDRLKNFVTGKGAKVEIATNVPSEGLGTPCISEPFDVLISASASSDLKVAKVYLKIRNMEALDQYPVSKSENESWVTDYAIIFDTELQVSGECELLAGEDRQWRVQVVLPQELRPTFMGKYIQNTWEFEAGLGTGWQGGVNPSTGWVDVIVDK